MKSDIVKTEDEDEEETDIMLGGDRDENVASLNMEKESVCPNPASPDSLFIPRRAKLLEKLACKKGSLSEYEKKVRAAMRVDSFGVPPEVSAMFKCTMDIILTNDIEDIAEKKIYATSRIPSVISSDPKENHNVYDMKYRSTWISESPLFENKYPKTIYYEITILKEGNIEAGFRFNSDVTLTVTYMSATGELYNCGKTMPYGYPFRVNDVIGCGLVAPDPCSVYAFFVHNGRPLRHVLCDLPQGSEPIVSIVINSVGCSVKTCFMPLAVCKKPPLSNSLLCALDNPQYFPDVCFCFRESPATILAHKAIIAARCPPLARRCGFSDAKGCPAPVELIILDEDAARFRNLLEFVYSGTVCLNDKVELEELFCLASRVGYDSLVMKCSEVLENPIAKKTDFGLNELLRTAFVGNSTKASHYMKLFIEKGISPKDFLECDPMETLAKLSVTHLDALMINDALCVIKGEMTILSRITVTEPQCVLEKDMYRMLKSAQFTDIQIAVGEKSVMAHRVVIAAMTEYLKGFLQKPFQNPGSSFTDHNTAYSVAREHIVDGCVFSVGYKSPMKNPDLLIGGKKVPLDKLMRDKEGTTLEKVLKTIASENAIVSKSLKYLNDINVKEKLVESKRMTLLGVFEKPDSKYAPVQQCCMCKAFILKSNSASMGACGHITCWSCFENALCAPLHKFGYITMKSYIKAVPDPKCPCHNCSKRISWEKILERFGLSEDDPIEMLCALAGTEKLRNAEVRRTALPVSIKLVEGCGFSIGAFKNYLSFMYSGYNKDVLKAKYVGEINNINRVFPDIRLIAVLRRMASSTSEVTSQNLGSAYWLSNRKFYTPPNMCVDIKVYLLNHFEEFIMKMSRHPNIDEGIFEEANPYVLRVSRERSNFPYAVLYAHYAPSKVSFNINEDAFRAAAVSPEDALIKYYIGKNLGFDDLRERARDVILYNSKVDPAAPKFAKIFGFFGKKYKKETVEEFISIVKARMGANDKSNSCCVCKKSVQDKVKCCSCGRMCCDNFKSRRNCSASLPVVPPEMDWVEGPGTACTVCRKVAIICFLN